MSNYLVKESMIVRLPVEKPQFFAKDISALDPKTQAALAKWNEDFKNVQQYLLGLEALIATNRGDIDVNTVEVPECLSPPKEKPRKKKATAARSSSKSQLKRKKIQSKSSTNQKKAE